MENPIIRKYELWETIFQKSENISLEETEKKYKEYLDQFPYDSQKAITYINFLIKKKEEKSKIEKK